MKNMKRMNLKELKDLLNKMPEKLLEKSAITSDEFCDSPTGERFIITCMADDDSEYYHRDSEWGEFVNSEEYKQINKRLIGFLNKDFMNMVAKNPNEDYGSYPDW